ncbi:MAG: DNA polymerase III subunit epsilon [Azospirillum brasilense]|nr:MAG: DNA polymerase III subunit epsilon [Azospirillum brasilense]
MREIVLDTETTGLDPFSGHRVVEIGCVELINHVRTGNHFHTYLNPQRSMPREAENVHGLSEEFLKDKPLFRQVASAFLEFIGDSPLVIHNAAFDMKFINAELNVAGKAEIPMARAIDTVLLARQKFPGQPASLDALCKRFSIDLTARTKHGALLDSELLADVYLELLGGRQSTLGLAQEEARKESAALAFSGHTDIPPRSFPPSLEELAAHQTMLAKLKKPLWVDEGEAN